MKLADLVQESGEITGTTGPGPGGHTHPFSLRITKSGDVVGSTGTVNGHKHAIKKLSSTEVDGDHSHTLPTKNLPKRIRALHPFLGGGVGRGSGGRTPPGGPGSMTGGGTGGGGMTGTGAGTGTPGTGAPGGGGGNGGGGGGGGNGG